MKTLVVVWNPAQMVVMQKALLDALDSNPIIKNYYVPFLGTILVVTEEHQDATKVKEIIHGAFPNLLFAVTPIDQWNSNGWMPQTFWDLVQYPKSSGRWDKKGPLPGSLEALLGITPRKK